MAHVFLSYASANIAVARQVAEALRSSGFSVWFDEHLPAHRAYSEVIEEQLDNAGSVVVLWSKESIASQWVRSEANRARELGRLVQARLDDARLPMPFDQIQCADLRNWPRSRRSAAWRSVEASVAALAAADPDDQRALVRSAGAIGRRKVILAGGAALLLAAGGGAAWRFLDEPEASPESQLLLQKGLDALQQNDALDTEQPPGAGAQAVALLSKATEALPDSPTAWGALAMAYAVRERAATTSERAGFAQRSQAAARRALALDRKDMRATAALVMLEPVYRNWDSAERKARSALRDNPTLPIHVFLLSDVLANVGRWSEAAKVAAQADRTRFLIPGADRKILVNLWAAGDMEGADRALDLAVARWPEHPQVWRTRMAYLMFSGRPSEALALIESAERPAAIPEKLAEAARQTAKTLAGSKDATTAINANLAYLRDSPGSALQVAQALAALGAVDETFAVLGGYYFGDGEWAALSPPGGDADRHTGPLFLPPMKSLWKRPAFESLVTRIGLDGYWQRSGKPPDYRKLS